MRNSRITITTAVFTSSVRVDAGAEGDVGAVVVRDDVLGVVPQELGGWRGVLLRVPVDVPLEGKRLKSIGRVAAGTPAACARSPIVHKSIFRHFRAMVESRFRRAHRRWRTRSAASAGPSQP